MTVPVLARLVYKLADLWDRFFSRIACMPDWRYRWVDYWCRCPRCTERRKAGLQAKYKGWRFWL